MFCKGATAIAGLGVTAQGKVYHARALGYAVEAIEAALADAGLDRGDLDGVLLNPGLSWRDGGMGSLHLQQAMGLSDLRLSATMNLGGATAIAMIQHAAMAIAAGLCSTVVCVFSDAPLAAPRPNSGRHGTGASSSGAAGSGAAGSGARYAFASGLDAAYGHVGMNARYAMVARRHMHRYGTTNDHFGAVAVAQRQWANRNPAAQLRDTPLTLEDYHRSRWIIEPFHLFDCCLVSNGGVAVIVTSAERARTLRRPPVYLWGTAQGHPGGDPLETLRTGAVLTREPAFRMAGLTISDIDFCELYDCYTLTVIMTLEDYGFCEAGGGGPFAASGATGPGGTLPMNTGGGQLSSFYM